MYAITGPFRSFGDSCVRYSVGAFTIYVTESAMQIVQTGQEKIYDMLCFDGIIKVARPVDGSDGVLFAYSGLIYYYKIAAQQIIQTGFRADADCNLWQIGERIVLIAFGTNLVVYNYADNAIVCTEQVCTSITDSVFYQAAKHGILLINCRYVYTVTSRQITLNYQLPGDTICAAAIDGELVVVQHVEYGLRLKWGLLSKMLPNQSEAQHASLKVQDDKLLLNTGEMCYYVSRNNAEIRFLKYLPKIGPQNALNAQRMRLIDHSIFVYSDFATKLDKIVPALIYYDSKDNVLTISSVTATKSLSFYCDPFELCATISTNRYLIFATSHYCYRDNESYVNLFGIQQFEVCQTINDIIVFGKVTSIMLYYFGDHFSCTMLTDQQNIYVYSVTDKSVKCINITGHNYRHVYYLQQTGLLVGIVGNSFDLINAIDEENIQVIAVDEETINLLTRDYFVMYSSQDDGKMMLPTNFSLQKLYGYTNSLSYHTLDGVYRQYHEYFDITPMQIINYITFFVGKCQKSQKYVVDKIQVYNDNYFNENSSMSLSYELSVTTETTQSDITQKIKQKLYLPDIVALKEKHLSTTNGDLLKQSITRTAYFCDFIRLYLDEEHDFFYYSQIFLCLFNTSKKFNNFGFTTGYQNSLTAMLQLLIPIIKAIDNFQSGNGLVQTVAYYLNIDSYKVSDLALFCSMKITSRNYRDLVNYYRTFSILVIFAIIYYVQIINEKFDNFYLFKQFESYIQGYCRNPLYSLSLLAVYDFMDYSNYCLDYAAIILLLIYYNTKCQNYIEQIQLTHLYLLEIDSQLDYMQNEGGSAELNFYIISVASLCYQMCQCVIQKNEQKIFTQKAFFHKQLISISEFFQRNHASLSYYIEKHAKKTKTTLQIQYLLVVLALNLFDIEDIFKGKFDDLSDKLSVAEQLCKLLLEYSICMVDESTRFFVYEQVSKFLIRSAVIKVQEMFRQIILAQDRLMYASFEKYLNFVRNSYPAIIQYYGVMIIEMIIPIYQQQFQQQILQEHSNQILQYILRIVGVLTRTCDHACTIKHNDITTLFLSSYLKQLIIFNYQDYYQQIIYNNVIYDIIRPVELDQMYIIGFSYQEMTITLINAHAAEGVCIPLLGIERYNSIFKRYEKTAQQFIIPDQQMFFCYQVTKSKQLIMILRSAELDNQEFSQHYIRINTAQQPSRLMGYFKIKRNSMVESRFTRKFYISAAETYDQIKLVVY